MDHSASSEIARLFIAAATSLAAIRPALQKSAFLGALARMLSLGHKKAVHFQRLWIEAYR